MRHLKTLSFSILMVFIFVGFYSQPVKAQLEEGTFLIDVSSDVYRTDNTKPKIFRRFAVALDFHYFPVEKLATGIGWEVSSGRNFWTTHARYYLVGKSFLRVRSRISGFFNTNEVMLGAGYDFMLDDENWAIEVQGDYYLLRVKEFGFRVGINWFI